MGNSNFDRQIERQENAIRQFRKQYQGDLSHKGKYNNSQINGKLRQLYYNRDVKNSYILDRDCKWKNNAIRYFNR
jgi:hypothetical protein